VWLPVCEVRVLAAAGPTKIVAQRTVDAMSARALRPNMTASETERIVGTQRRGGRWFADMIGRPEWSCRR
jgi:hypothetical protein